MGFRLFKSFSVVQEILHRQGYTVLLAKNGKEAFNTLGSHNGAVHLLLTDVIMPDMNGKKLFIKLVQEYPALKVLYMSGYTSNVIVHHGVLDDGVQFVQKPFTNQALSTKVREVLD